MIQPEVPIHDSGKASPMTVAHRALIVEINGKLRDIVKLATCDYFTIGLLLHECRDQSNLISAVEHQGWVSSIVTELQYIDVLKQKIEHMIYFLQEIAEPSAASPESLSNDGLNCGKTCGLIFKLNYFQLKVAQADLVQSVEVIQSKLRVLRSHPVPGLGLDFMTDGIFPNFCRVSKTADEVTISLNYLSELYPVTSEARTLGIVHRLLKQYSMESEREVLRWYLGHVEGSTDYLRLDNLREEQIHLF